MEGQDISDDALLLTNNLLSGNYLLRTTNWPITYQTGFDESLFAKFDQMYHKGYANNLAWVTENIHALRIILSGSNKYFKYLVVYKRFYLKCKK